MTEGKAKISTPNDPCPFHPEKRLRDCCGALVKDNGFVVSLKITEVETHHFFVMDPKTEEMLCDEEGRARVFVDRAVATAFAGVKAEQSGRLAVVIGMAEEKWKLFQEEVPHVVHQVMAEDLAKSR